ncbi:amidase family protein [Mycoplasmopsis arginini]|uniref:Asp-tRNA(Asn)/Glu-tRNA(Gln) amidotransferase subunit GatA n=1 Tax=Mycoplasmopsis arginini TaxID=2094 RepID=A0AA43TZM1_MYCAR|nr:amidase family protein [Mycoplasmopsis arginini]MCY2902787.1 Asp-tRNA(Asn)/Glu-tRNA(Gln) amidotransferase subunit GatA [Mycoplasmopsis arginini QMP CG1-2758]MDI3348087.1 Asp-tRNA(Asn)/Glu-tRNA(Gln) amidotransferase subunit GatA [Mycoplasmopsis arginini]MDI3348674.1 Asp-tRNA(Asn)/Glu-tRNA(Gln) amidotransferase subunit GatA [Mycoplasmopsis arginini]MDI3349525.1 Asp-tRNA(Asn)/Glu-tRNA(Gln) amidotransferase subunit GatA [Mycoplasmopsis arginini]MDI3349993.1 Asp-tRNA(Asn)/Glu-tRNA(Gln) amidotran
MKNKKIKEIISYLQSDDNNAVAYVFSEAKINNSGFLANTVFTVKDNYADVNVNCKGSSLLLSNFKPQYKSTVIKLLEENGSSCVARTNLDEFGLGGSGEYSAFGLIKNPLNKSYLVGGSSSGAAATFIKDIDFAIGSDTGDSVRKPASNIGEVGFKPSYGAISRYGLFAFASSLDTVAYFTHSIDDLIKISSVLYKQDLEKDMTSIDLSFQYEQIRETKPNKIAYLNCFDKLNPSIAKSYQKLLETLKNDGIELIEIKEDLKILNSIDVIYKVIAFSEASSNLANLNGVSFGLRNEGKNWADTFQKTRSQYLGKMVQSRLILGSFFLKAENQIKYFVKAKKMRRVLMNYFENIHNSADLFIFPASNDVAPNIKNGSKYKSYLDFILTYANLVGNPSLTMKLGKDSETKLPFNIAIDAKRNKDTKLFSHALYLEKKLGELNE